MMLLNSVRFYVKYLEERKDPSLFIIQLNARRDQFTMIRNYHSCHHYWFDFKGQTFLCFCFVCFLSDG